MTHEDINTALGIIGTVCGIVSLGVGIAAFKAAAKISRLEKRTAVLLEWEHLKAEWDEVGEEARRLLSEAEVLRSAEPGQTQAVAYLSAFDALQSMVDHYDEGLRIDLAKDETASAETLERLRAALQQNKAWIARARKTFPEMRTLLHRLLAESPDIATERRAAT